MTDKPTEKRDRLIDFYVEDATDRLRFQQEFAVAGFKTLVLINGGAVIALLTYAGNAHGRITLPALQWAFAGYIAGLVLAVLAYLAAYAGQAFIMRHSSAIALAEMGVEGLDQEAQKRRERRATFYIGAGVVLCVLSLVSFSAGSFAAMSGLTPPVAELERR